MPKPLIEVLEQCGILENKTMKDIVIKWIDSDPKLQLKFFTMADDAIAINEFDDATMTFAIMIRDWFIEWIECKELFCRIEQPLHSRQPSYFPVVESLYQELLLHYISQLEQNQWCAIASYYLQKSKEDLETVQR